EPRVLVLSSRVRRQAGVAAWRLHGDARALEAALADRAVVVDAAGHGVREQVAAGDGHQQRARRRVRDPTREREDRPHGGSMTRANTARASARGAAPRKRKVCLRIARSWFGSSALERPVRFGTMARSKGEVCAPAYTRGGVSPRKNQNEEPGSVRNTRSSSLVSRPRIAFRCGKRPKRATMSRCCTAKRRAVSRYWPSGPFRTSGGRSSTRPSKRRTHSSWCASSSLCM